MEILGDSTDRNCHFGDPDLDVNVCIGGGVEKTKWRVVTKGHLDKYYPTDGVYRIPAAYLGPDTLEISQKQSNKEKVSKKCNSASKSQEIPTKQLSMETEKMPDRYKNLSLRNRKEWKEMLSNATGYEKNLLKELLTKEEANLAEEEVLKCFETWGHDLNLNMFILGGYKYDCFLKCISPQPKHISRIKQGDFDILIICQQLGLIVVEVKSTSLGECEEPRNAVDDVNEEIYDVVAERMKKGWGQLMKGCYTAREMNRDLDFVKEIPSTSFLAFPNLEKSTLDGLKVCGHHRNFMLFKEDFTQFHKWLESHFPSLKKQERESDKDSIKFVDDKSCSRIQASTNAMTREQYRTLASRFVGLASVVQVETETIRETNTRMTCIFKTPEQLRLLRNEERRAVIFGDYGTGKSLVLSLKGVENIHNAKRRVKVHFVPCADLSNFKSCYGMEFSHQANTIKSLVRNQLPQDKQNDFVCYESFLHFYTTAVNETGAFIDFKVDMVTKAISEIMSNEDTAHDETDKREFVEHQFFFDEFPIQPLKKEGLRNLFHLDKIDNPHQEGDTSTETKHPRRLSTLWVSIATHSLGVSPDQSPLEALKSTLKFPTGVPLFYLDKVMRVPKTIHRMTRRIETYIAKGHGYSSSLGHIVDGITPKLYRLQQRHCTQSKLGCECQCSRERLVTVIKQITNSLEPCRPKVDEPPLQITLMLYYVMSSNMFQRIKKLLQDVCSELSIRLRWNTIQYQMKGGNKNTFTDGLITREEIGYDLVTEKEDTRNNNLLQEELGVEENRSPLTIQVVDQRTFAGCEASVLIFLDPFEMRHWFKRGDGTGSGYHSLIFTRCTGHFILVTWPKHEASAMWEKHLDEYKEEVLGSDATDEYKEGRCKYIDSGRKAHRESDETCLDVLLKEKFIVNVQTLE